MKQIVYISNSDAQSIEVWNLDKNGKMNLVQKIETDGQVQPIEIIKNKNLLYAGIRPNNRIITYSIKNNGFLEEKNQSYIPGNPNYISFNETKKFLFCSSYNSNCISVSQLNKYGIPQDPIQIIYGIEGCHAARMNNKYNILFVTALKEDCIYLYYLTNFGILKSTEQKLIHTKNKSGPRHIIFCPYQEFAYTVNELNGTVDVWKIYQEKNIVKVRHIQNVSILNNQSEKTYWSADIHLTSCGRFLYVSDRFFNTISLFIVDKKNYITLFKVYQTEEQPRSFYISLNNLYLIVAGQKSNIITVYSISYKNGELTKLNTYQTSQGPLWILLYTIN